MRGGREVEEAVKAEIATVTRRGARVQRRRLEIEKQKRKRKRKEGK